MPAAPLDCAGAHATVLIRFPPVERVVPAQQAAVTPTGRPTVKARAKSEINRLYAAAVLSHSLAVGREALAACPGLDEAAILLLTGGENATSPLAPICAIRIERPTLERIDWSSHPDAPTVALRFERLMLLKGQAAEVSPLSLVGEQATRHVVQEVAQQLGSRWTRAVSKRFGQARSSTSRRPAERPGHAGGNAAANVRVSESTVAAVSGPSAFSFLARARPYMSR